MTTTADEMACQELVELVTEYLEDALSERDRERLELHLSDCDGCSAYLEQMRTTIRLSGRLTEDAIPPEGKDELLGVYRSWRDGTPGREPGR